MNPTPFKSKTTPWRVQLPASLSPDRKRKARYFKTEKEAKTFCAQLRKGKGLAELDGAAAIATELKEHAPVIQAAIAKLGDSTKVFAAIELWEKMRVNIKGGIFSEVVDAFALARKGQVGRRTWSDDNHRLNKLTRVFGEAQIADISQTDLETFFEEMPGHTRSTHKTAKVFFKWATRKGFISIDPMASIEPRQRWKARKEIYSVETFERMLRIAAGLEGVGPGEEPTNDFLPLLPWMIISGFCGLRSTEAFRENLSEDAIKWSDLYFDRGFIHIRHDVAKRTKRENDERHIETAAYIEAAPAWLPLVPRQSEFICPAIERTLGELKTEFEARTGIKFLDNGFRNSFASYT